MKPRIVLLTAALFAGAAAISASNAQTPDSAEAQTRAALQRIEALNPRVNAVIAVDPTALDQARTLDRIRRARGPLFGMPILIKDNIETAGPLPTTAGSLALADNVTGRDAPLVARLRAAGAVIVGKTNLSEWANIRSNNSISRLERLWRPDPQSRMRSNRNPCGSSSGSGAAVAAGMVPAAIGTETDGSITCPAAINGIVGFKPTRRPGQPHPCRADQPQPGHAGADDAQRARRRSGAERDRRHRSGRSRHRRGRRAPRRLHRGAAARRAARACASG